MMVSEKEADVKRMAEQLYAADPDWVTFYREVLGVRGIVRQMFPDREALVAFEQTEAHQEILRMLTKLREKGPAAAAEESEPTRVITVRLPKSLHDALRVEAHEHCTSMNKLCISKLMKFIDSEEVPAERFF
jgi:predicted HicB family RNase H-like nuclease